MFSNVTRKKENVFGTFQSDESSFTCLKSLTIPAGEEAAVEIRFQPRSLEDTRCNITVTSEIAGEYV